MTATEVRPPSVSELLPRDIAVVPTVTALFVSELLPILESVLVEPEIDLFVSVCAPSKVTTVESIATVTAAEPL